MADSIELRASVTSIKRVDPYVKDIISTATQVALYKFNINTNEWEKTDKEGALFVYSRNGEPFHSLMVVNRINKDNFIEPIVKDFDYQMQVPFLLYRNSKDKIFGIWFFNREECIRTTFLIESLMESLKDKQDGKMSRKHDDRSKNGKECTSDIFSMLSRAQEDFNKTPTKPDSFPPVFSSTPRVPDVTSQSVMDFFAKASTKTTSKPIVSGGNNENVLHRLMSNPVHSVEHIEKQQRSITPQEQVRYKRGTSDADRRSVPITFPSKSSTDTKVDQKENGFSLPLSSSPSQPLHPISASAPSPLAFLIQSQTQNEADPPSDVLGSSPFAQFLENANKPQLMTPMMFTSPQTILTTKEKVMENSKFLETDGISADKQQEAVEMLTEKQLAQALIYLLKNNADFTKQIHEAYVSSIMEKVNTSKNGRPML